MKRNTIAAGSAIAIIVAWASAPLAQPVAGDFTVETVPAEAPFGELPVDPATIDLMAVGDFLATLTEEQKTELEQRCVVITENVDVYAADAVALCDAVIAEATMPAM